MRIGVVIGATGGIGSACAEALSHTVDGMVITGRNAQKLGSLQRKLGPTTWPLVADVTLADDRGAILEALGRPGRELAWVVFASGAALRGPFDDYEVSAVRSTLETNLLGPIEIILGLSAVPWARGASLIIIGSTSASHSLTFRSVYAASKAGLEQFAVVLSAEWARRGIKVNVVSPGVTDTPFLGEADPDLSRWAESRIPIGRPAAAFEVAEVVRYLVLEAPEYVIGSRLVVDGGLRSTL